MVDQRPADYTLCIQSDTGTIVCRTGSVVYINYKAQFQEESPAKAPAGRRTGKAGSQKPRAKTAGRGQKAYFARKAGFKRRK